MIKWKKISDLTHDNHQIITKIFFITKKATIRKELKIEYEISLDQLSKMIIDEINQVIKISLIISALHNIFYDLMIKEGNYYFLLNGKHEMYILKKKYYILY